MTTAAAPTTRNAPRRRGQCPGVLAPMAVGDGLLVRVRVPAGVLPTDAARRIAELAREHGNGLIDLSQRGNLQLRGVTEAGLGPLTEALRGLGYVSTDVASESVRNVLCSPTAGLDDTAVLDARPVALALDRRLAEDAALHGLPAKFGWLVDGGGLAPLSDCATDMRFVAVNTPGGPRLRVQAGGDAATATVLGLCQPDDVPEVAAALARAFLDGRESLPETPRRMARMMTPAGLSALLARLRSSPLQVAVMSPGAAPGAPPLAAILGPHPRWLGVAFPFGRLDVDRLSALAALTSELRLTPWRALLLVDPRAEALSAVRAVGGITDPADLRLKVTACSGVTGCDVGTTDTHADGLAIAARAPELLKGVRMVHVSGCAKGCAHPTAADVTLTAREGVYDIALKARAGAAGWRSGLPPADAVSAVVGLSCEELSRAG